MEKNSRLTRKPALLRRTEQPAANILLPRGLMGGCALSQQDYMSDV